ncbi:MAG: hypothetical protein IPN43_10910 [Chitinophagaceae bacterium]|nr:hypothetical protein [Chitinophagaceae bacterium]
MGTSKSFSALTKKMPNWPAFSGAVTRSCDGSALSNDKATEILSGYVTAIGGAAKAGRGGSGVAGKSGIRTAIKLGGFFGSFLGAGGSLATALNTTGITDLANKSVSDIINHLIEYTSGPSSTIDDKAAKEAARLLLEDLIGSANSVEEMEALLKQYFEKESHEELIIKYFGYYILEHLSVWFYEKLVQEKGKSECSSLFRQIKDFIFERLRGIHKNRALQNINWGTAESDELIKNMQQDVLKVFE